MAGHSKWANIKHRKSAQDAKRGKIWTKLLREITTAVKIGGAGEDNIRLRQAKGKALAFNMPRATIERGIKRAAGGEDDADYQSVVYEAYGPGGSALYIESLTDNKNRCVAAIRHSLGRYGGRLGTNGSVAYLFAKKAVVEVIDVQDEERLLQDAIDAEAGDVQAGEEGNFLVQGDAAVFMRLQEVLTQKQYQLGYKDIVMVAQQLLMLTEEHSQNLKELIAALEDLDDVTNVYSNVEFSK